jgi:hypothetical protein
MIDSKTLGDGKIALMSLSAAIVLLMTGGCDWMRKKDAPDAKSEKQIAEERRERIRKACASEATYVRLKELVFDEAARIRNSDPRNLDPLAAGSVVRMEKPLVKSRDEDLNVTVCSGTFFLELPPGAENVFDGKLRLSAEVEYAAQAAADGSGMVYQMDGAEPIIYRLAAFGMGDRPLPQPVPVSPPVAPDRPPDERVLAGGEPPRPESPEPVVKADRPAGEPAAAGAARPSFNCRYARTSTEKKVCASPALAAKDRAMASLYYDLMARSDPSTRSHLRRSRDSFLARRERCGGEECIAAAYDSRSAEIRRIAEGD